MPTSSPIAAVELIVNNQGGIILAVPNKGEIYWTGLNILRVCYWHLFEAVHARQLDPHPANSSTPLPMPTREACQHTCSCASYIRYFAWKEGETQVSVDKLRMRTCRNRLAYEARLSLRRHGRITGSRTRLGWLGHLDSASAGRKVTRLPWSIHPQCRYKCTRSCQDFHPQSRRMKRCS